MTGRMVSVSADSLAAVLPLLDEALAHGVSGRHPVADARAEITLALDQPNGDLLAWAEVRPVVVELARRRLALPANEIEALDQLRATMLREFDRFGLDLTDGTTGKAAIVTAAFFAVYAEIGATQGVVDADVVDRVNHLRQSVQLAVAMCAPVEVRTR